MALSLKQKQYNYVNLYFFEIKLFSFEREGNKEEKQHGERREVTFFLKVYSFF